MSLNLITIAEYKTFKGINSEQYDPTISLLIGTSSEFIQEYTGRKFIDYANTAKVELFDAVSYPKYGTNEFPIIELISLEVSVDGGTTYTVLQENTDFFLQKEEGVIIANTEVTGTHGFVRSNITTNSGKITYKGGYVSTPLDIKLACMLLVDYYRESMYVPSKNLSGASKEGTPTKNGKAVPNHILSLLNNYRVL